MKKIIAGMLVAVMMFGTVAPVLAEGGGGGVQGFLTGCCFGTRAVADFNAEGTGERDFISWFLVGFCLGARTQIDYANGQDFHWREWGRLIPYVGVVFAIWDGVDGANGKTRADYAEVYGSSYY
ncbi:MAG TPA: hypothetical protein VIR63_06500 [Pontiella sp.]